MASPQEDEEPCDEDDEYDAEVSAMVSRKRSRKAKPAGTDKITRRARPKYDVIDATKFKADLKPKVDTKLLGTTQPMNLDFRGYGRTKRTAGSGVSCSYL